jgi:succinate dehydrogenase / fumarate reductase cytochrome b subunit
MYGEAVYNEAVYSLNKLPYVVLLELLGIWLPIAFHGLLGVYIWWTGSVNVHRYPYLRNWLYVLQRLSGVFLLVFIAVHTAEYRFGGLHYTAFYGELTRHMKDWGAFAFYCAGVAAVAFHFANGLNTIAITWGVARSPEGQARTGLACVAVFIVVCGVGLHTLSHLRRERPGQPSEPPLFFRHDLRAAQPAHAALQTPGGRGSAPDDTTEKKGDRR